MSFRLSVDYLGSIMIRRSVYCTHPWSWQYRPTVHRCATFHGGCVSSNEYQIVVYQFLIGKYVYLTTACYIHSLALFISITSELTRVWLVNGRELGTTRSNTRVYKVWLTQLIVRCSTNHWKHGLKSMGKEWMNSDYQCTRRIFGAGGA